MSEYDDDKDAWDGCYKEDIPFEKSWFEDVDSDREYDEPPPSPPAQSISYGDLFITEFK